MGETGVRQACDMHSSYDALTGKPNVCYQKEVSNLNDNEQILNELC